MTHLANGPWKKSLNFFFPTKYVIPKSLKFSHWPSKMRMPKFLLMSLVKKFLKARCFRTSPGHLVFGGCCAVREGNAKKPTTTTTTKKQINKKKKQQTPNSKTQPPNSDHQTTTNYQPPSPPPPQSQSQSQPAARSSWWNLFLHRFSISFSLFAHLKPLRSHNQHLRWAIVWLIPTRIVEEHPDLVLQMWFHFFLNSPLTYQRKLIWKKIIH